jgi:hypothetical protein
LTLGVRHWAWQWLGVLLLAGLLDLAVRIGTGSSTIWVVRAEGVLFLAASLVLLALHRRHPPPSPRARRFQQLFIASLVLGGVRAAVWGLGLPVHLANALILLLAAAGAALVLWRRRRVRDAARGPSP